MTENEGETRLPPGAEGEQLDEFRTLVRSAFEQAQRKGKQDWEEMTSAVLKNRLLSITEGQFSQERYGSRSFINLVRRVPDLLEVLEDNPPFRLRIISPDIDTSPVTERDVLTPIEAEGPFTSLMKGDLRRVRIRDDLWRAVIDYSSHDSYVLDPDTGLARPKRASDADLPIIPTVSQEEVFAWRNEFIQSLDGPIRDRFAEELDDWVNGKGRQSDLPGSVRGPWAEFNKRKVINKLLDWFKERGKSPPKDMIFATEQHNIPSSGVISEVVQTRRLRDLVIQAVRAMTYEELSQVSLPASVILRISGRRSGEDE